MNEFFNTKKGAMYIVKIILAFLFGPILWGIYRIVESKGILGILWGILWIITGGLFGIGWIIDFVFTILNGKPSYLIF